MGKFEAHKTCVHSDFIKCLTQSEQYIHKLLCTQLKKKLCSLMISEISLRGKTQDLQFYSYSRETPSILCQARTGRGKKYHIDMP